jgi:hypothetical protein
MIKQWLSNWSLFMRSCQTGTKKESTASQEDALPDWHGWSSMKGIETRERSPTVIGQKTWCFTYNMYQHLHEIPFFFFALFFFFLVSMNLYFYTRSKTNYWSMTFYPMLLQPIWHSSIALRAYLRQSFDLKQQPEKEHSFEEISSYEEVGRIDNRGCPRKP